MLNWKIFIITHGPIIEDYYKNDLMFSNEHFTFFNVSETPIIHEKFDIINRSEFSNFISIGKWYAESEIMYNIYKNNIHKDLDYIGFIHWDFELKSENPVIDYNISSIIEKIINSNEDFISFSTYDFWWDFNQKIMMDTNYPNQLVGDGENCYTTIIKDYNDFYKTNISFEYLLSKKINLCCAFMCKISIFEELMPFFCWVIESKKLDKFDLNHQYRFQGGMMERYVGCFSHRYNFSNIPLYHRYNQNNYIQKNIEIKTKQKKSFKNLLIKIKRKLMAYGK